MNERFPHVLLLVLLLGQLALLSSRPEARGSRFERGALATLAPLARVVGASSDGVRGFFRGWRLNRGLRRDNELLRRQLADLRSELVRLHGIEDELDRLSRITGYTRRSDGSFLVADIVAVDHRSWLRSLILYTGKAELRPDQPVVTPDGLVGRVVLSAGRYAKVQLITDRSSSVSAMLERSRRKGIVRGAGDGMLSLDYIPAQAEVRPGDRIVTAGIDGIFPRSILVGWVVAVDPGQGLFQRIEVRPAIDFGLLDQVFVLTLEGIPQEILEALPDAPP